MQYLTKINGNFKIRIRIPKNLKPYFRKSEINKTLNTNDLSLAKKKALNIINEYNNIKLIFELNLDNNTYIENKVKEFSKKYLLIEYNENIDKNMMTHEKAFIEFKTYYNELDITESKKKASLAFLENIFLPLIGKKELIKDISFTDLNKLQDIFKNLPKRNIAAYRNISIYQLLKLAIPNEEKITYSTLSGYMKKISRFYNFCVASHYITTNPYVFTTKQKITQSEKDERESFTKDEIKKLISIINNYDEYKQAIYKTLLYTGMRISELYKAKLKKSEDYIYYFDLTEINIKLKTKNSYRIIPLHKKLIELNIQNILPTALELNKMNWIRRLFNEKIKTQITSSNKKVLYSFRHTIATELKYLNVKSEIISEILGHTNSNITLDRYASRYTFEVLKKEIDSIEFY